MDRLWTVERSAVGRPLNQVKLFGYWQPVVLDHVRRGAAVIPGAREMKQ